MNGHIGDREYLPQAAGPVGAAGQLLRVAERDLLEPDAVLPGGAGNVQVPVDDGFGSEAQVPACGSLGSAPLRELGVTQDAGGLACQREMADQDRPCSRWQRSQ